MKITSIATAALAALALATGVTRAAEINIDSASYRFSGSSYLFTTANQSQMYRSGLGYGSYQSGSVTARVANLSYYSSGTIVLNLWVSPYIGATTGSVIYSKGWGGNTSNVFSARQTWTCTKTGYRKLLNRYGYASIGAHEYTGSWPMRDETYFSSSYGKY